MKALILFDFLNLIIRENNTNILLKNQEKFKASLFEERNKLLETILLDAEMKVLELEIALKMSKRNNQEDVWIKKKRIF